MTFYNRIINLQMSVIENNICFCLPKIKYSPTGKSFILVIVMDTRQDP